MFGPASREHVEIAFGKALGGLLVDGVKRVHQAIAERVGVDVKWRVDEVGNVGPHGLIAWPELDGGPEAFPLHLEPDLADPLGGELAIAPLEVNLALERI